MKTEEERIEQRKRRHDRVCNDAKLYVRDGFQIGETEIERANAFIDKHRACEHHPSAVDQKFEFRLRPTSIVLAVHIKCLDCGVEENITDYDCL